MTGEYKRHAPWTAHLMMVVSIVAACVLVPLGFILSGSFSAWLKSTGVHASPNLSDGLLVAEFNSFDGLSGILPEGVDPAEAESGLAIRTFGIRKVAFRRFSGIGIEPRVNLCFEFDGRLGNSRSAGGELGSTVIHVYLKAPGEAPLNAASQRSANVDFDGPGWNYEVIVDGFHDQARIFDGRGNLLGRGLGLYVRHEDRAADGTPSAVRAQTERTLLTAAVPMKLVGDPAAGEWKAYLLVGLADSRHPSMMMHSGPDGSLRVFRGVLANDGRLPPGGRPRLRPLVVRSPA